MKPPRYSFHMPDGTGFWGRSDPDGWNERPKGPKVPFIQTGFHPRQGLAATGGLAHEIMMKRVLAGKLTTAGKMAKECYDLAEAFIKEGQRRGHVYDMPTLAELDEALPPDAIFEPKGDTDAAT